MKEGWKTKRLDEICEVQYGTRVVQKRDGGQGYPVYGGGGATFALDSFNREDRVVVGRFGMSEQCTRFVKGKFFLNDSGLTLAPKNARELSPMFLDWWTVSRNDRIFALGKGSAQKNLDVPAFRCLHVDYPACAMEQQRIVDILDEASAAIATAQLNAEKNLQNARALFDSHLAIAFVQPNSPHPARRLEELCDITVGHVGPMAKRYQTRGIPFLRSQNIRPMSVVLENVVFIDEGFHQTIAKSALKPGDVAIVRTGYPGTAAVIPTELGVANCSDLVIVRPRSAIDAEFLAFFFNSATGKERVAGRLVGAAQKHFNVTAAKQVEIALPPLDEQRRTALELSKLSLEAQRLESIYRRKNAALDELKKSLLHRAFAGEL